MGKNRFISSCFLLALVFLPVFSQAALLTYELRGAVSNANFLPLGTDSRPLVFSSEPFTLFLTYITEDPPSPSAPQRLALYSDAITSVRFEFEFLGFSGSDTGGSIWITNADDGSSNDEFRVFLDATTLITNAADFSLNQASLLLRDQDAAVYSDLALGPIGPLSAFELALFDFTGTFMDGSFFTARVSIDEIEQIATIPLPGAGWLFGSVFVGVWGFRSRQNRRL